MNLKFNKTGKQKLSKTFNILAVASIAAILLGSITFFSEQAYSSHAGGNLVVHYDFEDAVSPTSDVSGHGNDGTLFGGAGFSGDVPPIPGNTKSLDLTTSGLLDYLIKNPVDETDSAFPSTAITTALWVKASGTQNADPIFVSYATNAAGTSFNDWGIQNVGTLPNDSEFQGFVNNGVLRTTDDPHVLDGEWHHVAASWQSSDGQMKLYMDGNLIKTVLGLKTGESIAGAGSLVLGQEQDNVGNNFHLNDDFNGLLDDVRIYDRVLTDTEVNALATQGCSPGHWKSDAKRNDGAGDWLLTGLDPDTADGLEINLMDDFPPLTGVKGPGADADDPTLRDALNTRKGNINALAREAAAAVLNDAHPGIDYGLTIGEIKAIVTTALDADNDVAFNDARDLLRPLNHAGCPI